MASPYGTTNGSYGGQEQQNTAAVGSQYAENDSSAEKQSSVDKDQVGWYFVERYYSILSEKSDQLHLFYNKKSQFIYGEEAEVLPVLVGRTAIQQRIRDLDFAGSKIRIANVDSQETEGDCIVVQVIGEMYNNTAGELVKFVQTFVLAKQLNGYYVLNDIFRSLKATEEDQEATAVEEDAPVVEQELAAKVEEPKAEPVEEPNAAVLNADVVDKKLESAIASESAPEAPVTNGNGVSAEVDKAEEAPVAATKPEVSPTPEVAEKEVEEETAKEMESPKDPSPTPAPATAPPKAKPASPVQPAAPPKPMTWAGVASTGKSVAAVSTKPATPPVQPRAAAAAAAPPPGPAPAPGTAAPTQPSQAAPATSEPSGKESASQSQGWQTAGSDQKRQTRPQSVASPVSKQDDTLGYVRNVSEKVDVQELRSALAKHGELVYFDVNRSKNCAFVEFANAAGYNAAVAANPHVLGGENIIVEPRRPKAAAYGGTGYNNNNRGAMNNRGRGNFDQGRQGSQGGGRGAFQQRGRGTPGGAPRGNGQRPAGQTTAV